MFARHRQAGQVHSGELPYKHVEKRSGPISGLAHNCTAFASLQAGGWSHADHSSQTPILPVELTRPKPSLGMAWSPTSRSSSCLPCNDDPFAGTSFIAAELHIVTNSMAIELLHMLLTSSYSPPEHVWL